MKTYFWSILLSISLFLGCDTTNNSGNNGGNNQQNVQRITFNCDNLQTLSGELQVNGCYELTLKPLVRIHIGGAAYDRTMEQLHSGSQVGSIYLSAAQFAEIERSVGKFLKFQVARYGTLDLRNIRVTNQISKENIDGLFYQPDRSFIFGNGDAQRQGECGVAALGIAKGAFSADFKSIQNGEFSINLIGGCNPIVAGANLTFYFTATQVNSSLQENAGTWDIPNDATSVESRLTAKRWKIQFAAQNGNTVNPQPKDFIQLNPDGTVDQVFLNLYQTGTWRYIVANRSVEITASNGTKTPFLITTLSDSTLQAFSFNNEFRLTADTRPPEDCNGVSAKTCTLVSGKWKIRSFRFGLLTPTYHPQDFARFYRDGTYEHSLLGIYHKGTWSWTNNETRLLIPNVQNWNVQTLTATQLSLREGQFDQGELYR